MRITSTYLAAAALLTSSVSFAGASAQSNDNAPEVKDNTPATTALILRVNSSNRSAVNEDILEIFTSNDPLTDDSQAVWTLQRMYNNFVTLFLPTIQN